MSEEYHFGVASQTTASEVIPKWYYFTNNVSGVIPFDVQIAICFHILLVECSKTHWFFNIFASSGLYQAMLYPKTVKNPSFF